MGTKLMRELWNVPESCEESQYVRKIEPFQWQKSQSWNDYNHENKYS
jgi:hypothetical protein